MYLDYKVRSAFSTFGLKADDNLLTLKKKKRKRKGQVGILTTGVANYFVF